MSESTNTDKSATTPKKGLANEPWGIWVGIAVVILVLVVAVVTMGPAGLVAVMVPVAIGMVVLLSIIVFG